MTCIIGLIDNGTVYMGADSLCSNYSTAQLRNDPKIYRVGAMLIGFTSSYRMGQILGYNLTLPEHHTDISTDRYLRTSFIEAVRTTLKQYGYAEVNNNVEEGGFFLVGYRGKLYAVESDYQVAEYASDYASVGSGADVALGAMYANANASPTERITKALEAAAEFNPYVRAPFIIEQIDK